ncbi:MAG: cell division protein FtsQ/DivIB [Gammaproteobacteria bacterium]|nr:cell division protein FtsQ/DivIB [Gammaproteobacteria bacterium]NNF49503.1 FtsQ-type POTRA domain-containing protein [Woeseiaceae bacterium]MBT8094217.1 cell division protein FtsQ/DivIB [Gammaproteobacteria bacterium]MBT8104570.1 cell division protein FtsQ/DivIB [Gammaproteobacteria bacterium]NNK24584.1 FtsQ-type POTRA domain-containing protein [Woeseiaceae bacterium]
MGRKQAKRRKQKKARTFTLPRIRIGRIVAPLVAVGIVVATYHVTIFLLDRDIAAIEISGPFQRVTALQIEEAIGSEVDKGFVGANLDRIRADIVALQWIDQARVARRWPNRLTIAVTEQVPAAIWGERGLLNTRGDLFVSAARHTPAELPRLSGPDGSSARVARRYLDVRDKLIPAGLDLRSIHLDARGAWNMTLGNGIEVRIGRRNVGKRTDLFLDVVAGIISGRAADIEYVDMRYGNGFTIGWKGGPQTPVGDAQGEGKKLLASRGAE